VAEGGNTLGVPRPADRFSWRGALLVTMGLGVVFLVFSATSFLSYALLQDDDAVAPNAPPLAAEVVSPAQLVPEPAQPAADVLSEAPPEEADDSARDKRHDERRKKREAAAKAETDSEANTEAATAAIAVTITSQPRGVMVRVDGKTVGATPVVGASFPAGTHTIEMRLGNAHIKRTVTLGEGRDNRFHWGVEADDWLTLDE
jgi:type IV secretory pathway VirB10-like protein